MLLHNWQKRRYRRAPNLFRILPIKVTFYFKINWLVALQFKEVLKENKERKHLRGWEEIAKGKENGGQMKRYVDIIQELKTARLLFKRLPTFKMLWLWFKVHEFFRLCFRQLWLFLQLVVYRSIMKTVRVNIFWGYLRPVLGKLVSSTFEKKYPFYLRYILYLI